VFEGADTFEGRPIHVRFTWSGVTTPTVRWEQAFSEDGGKTWETNWIMEMRRDDGVVGRELPVVELARYLIRPGERGRFARCFEGYFPEAFQQLGAVVLGQFLERKDASRFAWLRGFPSLDARAEVKGDFYDGPLWKEHAAKMNDRLVAYDDVLLLRPLAQGRGLPVPPAIDLGAEAAGVAGIVVIQVFAVRPGRVDAFAPLAEEAFSAYRAAGTRELGTLVTLDAPNNFPRHPIRTDGPHLVWVGVVEGDAALAAFEPRVEGATRPLLDSGLLREAPELVVLDPTPRSRLRWRPEWK
jgi:hypothetical protein